MLTDRMGYAPKIYRNTWNAFSDQVVGVHWRFRGPFFSVPLAKLGLVLVVGVEIY